MFPTPFFDCMYCLECNRTTDHGPDRRCVICGALHVGRAPLRRRGDFPKAGFPRRSQGAKAGPLSVREWAREARSVVAQAPKQRRCPPGAWDRLNKSHGLK